MSCASIPTSTVYSTPVVTSSTSGTITETRTIPGYTSTVTTETTSCVVEIIARRGAKLQQRSTDCWGYYTTLTETSLTTVEPVTTTQVAYTDVLVTLTLDPVPVETLFSSSCAPSTTSSSSSSSTTSSTSSVPTTSSSSSSSSSTIPSSSIPSTTSSSSTSSSSTSSPSVLSTISISSATSTPLVTTSTSTSELPSSSPTPNTSPTRILETSSSPAPSTSESVAATIKALTSTTSEHLDSLQPTPSSLSAPSTQAPSRSITQAILPVSPTTSTDVDLQATASADDSPKTPHDRHTGPIVGGTLAGLFFLGILSFVALKYLKSWHGKAKAKGKGPDHEAEGEARQSLMDNLYQPVVPGGGGGYGSTANGAGGKGSGPQMTQAYNHAPTNPAHGHGHGHGHHGHHGGNGHHGGPHAPPNNGGGNSFGGNAGGYGGHGGGGGGSGLGGQGGGGGGGGAANGTAPTAPPGNAGTPGAGGGTGVTGTETSGGYNPAPGPSASHPVGPFQPDFAGHAAPPAAGHSGHIVPVIVPIGARRRQVDANNAQAKPNMVNTLPTPYYLPPSNPASPTPETRLLDDREGSSASHYSQSQEHLRVPGTSPSAWGSAYSLDGDPFAGEPEGAVPVYEDRPSTSSYYGRDEKRR